MLVRMSLPKSDNRGFYRELSNDKGETVNQLAKERSDPGHDSETEGDVHHFRVQRYPYRGGYRIARLELHRSSDLAGSS